MANRDRRRGAAASALLMAVAIAAGVGHGLVRQPAFMLRLDLFAESRRDAYLAALRASPG